MQHRITILMLAAFAAAMLTGCAQTASVDNTDPDLYLAADADDNLEPAPAQYPWCDALDGYYRAHRLWLHGDNQWSRYAAGR